jgi:PAS domain S-box-containing protein
MQSRGKVNPEGTRWKGGNEPGARQKALTHPLLGNGPKSKRASRAGSGKHTTEEALAELTARFDGIISSAMDAIISTDARQRIVLFNPAAEHMFGVSSAEAVGESLDRFIPERFRRAHAGHVEHFAHTGVSARRMGALGTIFGLRANGEEFPIEASISQVEVGGERLFTVILRDVTKRQQAEAELREARAALELHAAQLEKVVKERTARLSETVADLEAFSYSLSHDLRASLRAVQTFTQIVLGEHEEIEPEGREMLGRVLSAAERMDRLMRGVLEFSRVTRQELPMQEVQPEKVIREFLEERPEFQAPAAEFRLEGPLLPMWANPAGLAQCLSNLLDNAVKFIAPGVRPVVRIWTEAVRHASNSAAQDGGEESDYVRLWVEDNGIGIEAQAKSRLFQLFQRLHGDYEGTGIGLATVRRVAERMGGGAGVESEPGKGSRFWIELPAAPRQEAVAPGETKPG